MALKLNVPLVNRMMGNLGGYNLLSGAAGTFVTNPLSVSWTNTLGGTHVATAGAGARGSTGYVALTSTGTAAEIGHTAGVTVNGDQDVELSLYVQRPTSLGSGLTILVGTTFGGAEVLTYAYDPIAADYDTWKKLSLSFRVPSATDAIVYVTLKATTVTNTYRVFVDEVDIQPASNSLADTLGQRCFLSIYSGTAPTTADSPLGTLSTNTELCRYYSDGTAKGLTFESTTVGVIAKPAFQTWSGTSLASGTATFFRFWTYGDNGSANTITESVAYNLPRIQGSVATSGADLNLTTTTITVGAVQTINAFSFTLQQG